MLRHGVALLCCGALLASCSTIMGPPDSPPPDPAPQPLPPIKQILANSTDVLFDATANPRNVAISELRRFDTAVGSEFGVCMRATVTGRSGKEIGNVVYVVTVIKNRVSDRRRAVPADGCDREKYEPLKF
jgi:hypothetical protein